MQDHDYINLELTVTTEIANQRIDIALLTHEKIVSRSQSAKLFRLKLVKVNNKIAKPSYITQYNDVINIKIPISENEDSRLLPYDIPLDIVHEDDDLLVINKPAGLVMHPSAGHNHDSLVNALIAKGIKLSSTSEEKRPGIVHRIDKDTSGLVVVAKSREAHIHLAAQFKDKKVHRVYHAITFGYLKNQEDTITTYLIRHPKNRKKISNERLVENKEPKGKKAITHYQVLNQKKGISLVRCQLETGRTHQIRVHLTEINHPIVNDPIYSSSRVFSNVESKHVRGYIKSMNGIGLLAKELGFTHPTSGKKLMFKCQWPEDVQTLLNFLEWPNE